MVRESLNAFVNRDAQAARRISLEDEEVNQYNRESIPALWRMMQQCPETAERDTHLFSISRHLERIADHATNIAWDVVYMVEGKTIGHRAEDSDRRAEPSWVPPPYEGGCACPAVATVLSASTPLLCKTRIGIPAEDSESWDTQFGPVSIILFMDSPVTGRLKAHSHLENSIMDNYSYLQKYWHWVV